MESPGKNPENPAPRPKPEEMTDPVFYYSRAHRLGRASEAVRDLNENKPGGASRRIPGSKANLLVLAAIFMVVVMYYFIHRSAGGRAEAFDFDGNSIALSITGAGAPAGLSLALKKTASSSSGAYTGPVDIAISPYQKKAEGREDTQVTAHRIFFGREKNESFDIPIPFTGAEFIIILQSENARGVRRLRPVKE
jgi:hypothetical protein